MCMRFDPNATSLPERRHLPVIPDAPSGAAWFWGPDDEVGFDNLKTSPDGAALSLLTEDSQLGRLNLLTPQRTAAAAKLIDTGEVVNLNLRADLPDPPMFGREPFKFSIKSLGPAGNDDLHSLNTQSGSQWDGFRHVSTKKENGDYVFYNNVSELLNLRPTMDRFGSNPFQTTSEDIANTSRCGIQAWAEHGIVGRGVLLDYWHYAEKRYDPNTTHAISLEDLRTCAKLQGVEFQYGDILMIRTGWVDVYNEMSHGDRQRLGNKSWSEQAFVGVEQSPEMADFLHDEYFSVVASDAPAFEAWPTNKVWNHHENLLPLWGVPIGEMWDLEKLATTCRKHNRWSFFFSSIPTNVAGGVGSYPNALAVF